MCKCFPFQPADGSTGKHWKLILEAMNITNIYTNANTNTIQYNVEMNLEYHSVCHVEPKLLTVIIQPQSENCYGHAIVALLYDCSMIVYKMNAPV